MKDSCRIVDMTYPLPVASTDIVQPLTTHTFLRVAIFIIGIFKGEDQIMTERT